MKFYSKSNLKTECRYKYYNDFNTGWAAMRGSALHLCTAYYIINKKLNDNEIKLICEREGMHKMFWDDIIALFRFWERNKGWKILKYKDIICVESSDSNEFVHGKRVTKLPLTDEYGLHGIFDLVCRDIKSGEVEVIDWKTGAFSFDNHFEQMINGTLAYIYYGEDTIKSSLYSISQDIESGFYIDSNNIDKCILAICNEIDRVKKIDDSVEDKKLLPRTVNKNCCYCGKRSECDEYLKSLNSVPVFKKTGNLEEIIAESNRLGSIKKACESEVNLLCTSRDEILENGEVHIGDYIYFIEEVEKLEQDTEHLYEALCELGYSAKANKILKFTKKDLEVLLEEIRAEDGDESFKIVKELISTLKKENGTKKKIRKRLA